MPLVNLDSSFTQAPKFVLVSEKPKRAADAKQTVIWVKSLSLTARCGLTLTVATVESYRNHAQEPQGLQSRVAELMKLVRWYQDHLAGANVMRVDTCFHDAFTALHDHFVLVIVLMEGRMAVRFNLELPYGESRSLVVAAHQDAKLNELSTRHRHRLPVELIDIFDHDSSTNFFAISDMPFRSSLPVPSKGMVST